MNALVEIQSQAVGFKHEEVEILKTSIMKGATDAELSLFAKVCAQTGLSPFARQIYPVAREVYNKDTGSKDKVWSFQTSVDGFRLVAQRSGEYEGQTAAQWCGKDGVWKDIWLSEEYPIAARVGVYRKNFREAVYAVARWDSYRQGYMRNGSFSLSPMWAKMPDLMLAKCAECLALRKAFPQELSGIYSAEEMGQAENKLEGSDRNESPESDEKPRISHGVRPEPGRGIVTQNDDPRPAPEVKPTIKAKAIIERAKKNVMSPDHYITEGKKAGTRFDEMSHADLTAWATAAKAYLEGKGLDPESDESDMARSYRGIQKYLAKFEASFENQTKTTVWPDFSVSTSHELGDESF